MKTQLYAFWEHDKFPFILGGTVTEKRKDGSVETKEYGVGYYFKPFAILPLNEGLELKKKLTDLKDARQETLEWIEKGFEKKRVIIRATIETETSNKNYFNSLVMQEKRDK